jgi:hypothetical protein
VPLLLYATWRGFLVTEPLSPEFLPGVMQNWCVVEENLGPLTGFFITLPY